ncbi:MAG: fibronectin type III domain-containing protein [Candidatus Sericytochromatia bacterium]
MPEQRQHARILSARTLSALCALSLSACTPVPTANPTSSLPGPEATPSATASATPSAIPSPGTSADLSIRLQADASLSGFATQQAGPFALCLGRIARADTTVRLTASLSDSTRAALTAAGIQVGSDNRQTLLTLSRELNLAGLLGGIELRFAALPAGTAEGRSSFFDASGTELGFVSWQATGRSIRVLLKPHGSLNAGQACPQLDAEVSGGQFLGAGGQLTGSQPLPNPQSSPSSAPGASPEPGPVPGAPQNVRVVEQTSNSLTLQWDFPVEVRSFRLYLDGAQVAGEYVTPNYYRFENLRASTSYRLGVQSVNPAGASEIVSVSSSTLKSGHSGSGNFSGGGSSQPKASPSAGIAPSGEFQVNTYTSSKQGFPALAMDADGDFVIAWNSYYQDGDGIGIFAQRYNSAGVAQGSEFQVNTYTGNHQRFPAVAIDADGDFVISWNSYGQDGDGVGVFAQRFNSAGVALGSEFQVNTYTSGAQLHSSLAMDASGDFVISWYGKHQNEDNYGVFARRYNSAGVAQASELHVNTFTTGNQHTTAVAMDADGDFVITWTSYGQDGDVSGIFAQRYNSAGQAQASEFPVNSYTSSFQRSPAVAMDSTGNFVISWESVNQDGSSGGVYAQRYHSLGQAQGSVFAVNTYTTGLQRSPAIAMDAEGDFLISWHSAGQVGEGYYYDVFAQRYNSQGQAQGTEFQVNSTTIGDQRDPAVAMDANGDFVIAWGTYHVVNEEVFAQRYRADGTAR